jgi:hypothetical protein
LRSAVGPSERQVAEAREQVDAALTATFRPRGEIAAL